MPKAVYFSCLLIFFVCFNFTAAINSDNSSEKVQLLIKQLTEALNTAKSLDSSNFDGIEKNNGEGKDDSEFRWPSNWRFAPPTTIDDEFDFTPNDLAAIENDDDDFGGDRLLPETLPSTKNQSSFSPSPKNMAFALENEPKFPNIETAPNLSVVENKKKKGNEKSETKSPEVGRTTEKFTGKDKNHNNIDHSDEKTLSKDLSHTENMVNNNSTFPSHNFHQNQHQKPLSSIPSTAVERSEIDRHASAILRILHGNGSDQQDLGVVGGNETTFSNGTVSGIALGGPASSPLFQGIADAGSSATMQLLCIAALLLVIIVLAVIFVIIFQRHAKAVERRMNRLQRRPSGVFKWSTSAESFRSLSGKKRSFTMSTGKSIGTETMRY